MATRKWGTEILVNTTLTGNQDQSTLTALADGGFAIAWRDDGPAASLIRYQRYDAAGSKIGGEITDTGDRRSRDTSQRAWTPRLTRVQEMISARSTS